MPRILVTGGAGFIGSHTVDLLVGRGDQVTVLDNLDPQVHTSDRPVNLAHLDGHPGLRFIRGDIRSGYDVARSLEDVDAVVHLAAAVGVGQSMYHPSYYTDVNVAGQGVLMEAMVGDAGRFRKLVVASSMSVYGEGAYRCVEHGSVAPGPRPESQLARGEWEVGCPVCGRILEPMPTAESKPGQHTSVYAVTKKAQEELALSFGPAYAIPTMALRLFNVYGSRQALSNPYTGVAAIFMSRLKNGNPPLVFEDGAQSRDFIHVHDVARAIAAALDAHAGRGAPADSGASDGSHAPAPAGSPPSAGSHAPALAPSGALNVCTGRSISIAELARVLARRLGADLDPQVTGRFRAGDIRHCFGDPAAAASAIGFRARVDLESGLEELLAWARDQDAADHVATGVAELERHGLVR